MNAPATNTKQIDSATQTCPGAACDVSTFVIECGHGRAIDVIKGHPTLGNQFLFQILTSTQTPDKITPTYKGDCGTGTADCPIVTAKNNNETIKLMSDQALTITPTDVSIDDVGFERFIDHYFLLDLIPKIYQIQSDGCCGAGSHRVVVQAFPKAGWSGKIKFGYEPPDKFNRVGKQSFYLESVGHGNLVIEVEFELSLDDKKSKISFSLERDKAFEPFRNSLKKLLPLFSRLSAARKEKTKGSGKLNIQWPAIEVGGSLTYEEVAESHLVDTKGQIDINMAPFFGADVEFDILDYILAVAPTGYSQFLLSIKREIANGVTTASNTLEGQVILEIVLTAEGKIEGALGFTKHTNAQWETSGEIKGRIGFGLKAKTEFKGRVVNIILGIGGNVSLATKQGESNVAINSTVKASVVNGKPSIEGGFGFEGAAIFYTAYLEFGVKGKQTTKSGKLGKVSTKNMSNQISTKGKLCELIDEFSWPKKDNKSVVINKL